MTASVETFEVDFTSGPMTPLASATWTTISGTPNRVLGCNTRRGRKYDLDPTETGGGQLRLDNSDRAFEPFFTGSPFYPNILPLRRFRWSTTPPGGSKTAVFTGYIADFPVVWEGDWSELTVTLVDAFEILSVCPLVGTFAAGSTQDRFTAVLDAIGWPAADRVISGVALGTCQAVTFAAGDNVNALQHLMDVLTTEASGLIFADAQGRLVFQGRALRRGTLTSALTIADFAVPGTSFPAARIVPAFDRVRIANDVTVTATGGAAQNAQDSASIAAYGDRALSIGVMSETDQEALAVAQGVLHERSLPLFRFDRVETEPWFDDGTHWAGMMAAMLARELSDRVTVAANPPNTAASPTTVTRDGFIEAVEHDLMADPLAHTVAFDLSTVDPYRYWKLGTSTLETGSSTCRLGW